MRLYEIMENKRGRKDLTLRTARAEWEDEEFFYLLLIKNKEEYFIERSSFDTIDFLDPEDIIADDWKIVGY